MLSSLGFLWLQSCWQDASMLLELKHSWLYLLLSNVLQMLDSAANETGLQLPALICCCSGCWIVGLRYHFAYLSCIKSCGGTLLLSFWVQEILEQNGHFYALEIMEEDMAAASQNSQEQQQPKLCATFWLAGRR